MWLGCTSVTETHGSPAVFLVEQIELAQHCFFNCCFFIKNAKNTNNPSALSMGLSKTAQTFSTSLLLILLKSNKNRLNKKLCIIITFRHHFCSVN